MAAATLPTPGTEVGPCTTACEHTDCAETRRMAETCCVYCGQPIGYETRFYRNNGNERDLPAGAIVREYVHATCEESR